jgi:hypothetical protein
MILTLIIAIASLIILMIVHEFGHFIIAKKFGVRVEEFGIGYPPKLFGRKFGETEYSLNLIPFGAFVRIYGEETGVDDYRSFSNLAIWKRMLICLGGVTLPVDNAAFTDGTTPVMPIGFIYDEVAGTGLTENDIGAARMNANRASIGVIEDGGTRTRYATVKPGSTAAVAGDTALVVALNPGSSTVGSAQGATTSGLIGPLVQGAVTTGVPVYSTGTTNPLSLNTAGALRVDASGYAVPVSDNGGSLTVDYATTGSGTATGALRVELANNGTGTLSTVSTVSTVTNVATIGTSVTPGTAAANLGKAEDAVAASGDTGVAVWAVRTDTPATTTSGSGDYHPFEVDANGALWTHPIQSSFRIEVDSAGLTTATTAYTSGDHAGTVNTFANAARVTGWGGVITGAALIDKSLKVSTISVELWLFQSQPASPGADNAALTFADTDMNNFVGIITFDSGSWKTTALNAVNHQANLGMGYTCAATSLFGYYVLRGVPSGNFFSATSDLRVSLQMLRD